MVSSDDEDPADLFGEGEGEGEGEDDLFGDEDEQQSEKERALSDRELDSGDDEDRDDRARDRMDGVDQEDAADDREARVLDAALPRQVVPKPSDGELHILRLPKFLGLAPKAYDASTFTIPTADHHTTTRSANFSASATANTTIRYQKNPDTGRLESNAIMSRWSDGSVTIAIGNETYELQPKPLAPPMSPHGKGYQDVLDSHQYLATPYVESQLLHIVGHMTNQYTVKPNKEIQDDALAKLASGLAAAARGRNKGDNKSGLTLISTTQDPEMQKKQAEMAEKERMKAQRRRETAAARADQQAGKVRSGIGGGLTLDDLERGGSRNLGSRKKRPAPAGPRRARRRADYDSDDDLPHGRSREDEYDLEDDFLAPSDEEIEADEGDDDESEEIDEGSEAEKEPQTKKRKTETASRAKDTDAEGESDVDAEGEIDDGGILESVPAGDATAGRGRKRQIIEDDDDE